MTTTYDDALKALYIEWSSRMAADPTMSIQTMRDMQEAWSTAATEPEGASYADVDIDGLKGIWCIPQNADPQVAILYFHGGGMIVGSAASHRKLAGHLARAVGARVLVIDYRRAPENLFPAQLDDGVKAYQWLIDQGYAPGKIISAGDSAGGTLSLGLVVNLRQLELPLPGAVLALSPGLDWEGLWMINEDTDQLAKKAVIVMMGGIAFGERSRTDALTNPLYADLAVFPPVYVAAGGHENLLGAARQFLDRATAAGVDVVLDVADERQHVYPIAAGNDPEADRTLSDFAAWVRPRVGIE
ncbi:alpha/beta hydrolase [Gordonia sp. TBRC 11910]|uniref:Alpha/beta hydrolase n=1 Tax=Gordonia asplenii TaxID=2725283 RepID=A0A848L3D2_9ACTN|nr:alpha/beta hydrolase [Gordonia asplenii]NMO03081.1 alpha/beta hydrolase [Gordonia asplenii]